jgi:hypothetical protein
MALLVSAYYPLDPPFHNTGSKDWDHRLEQFLRIARLDFPVLVFTDEKHGNLIRPHLHPTDQVEVNTTTFPDFRTMATASLLRTYFHSLPHLPSNRNPDKDTMDYMTLQLCKAQFVASALRMERYRDRHTLAWFDFSLGKLVSTENLVPRFHHRLDQCIPGKILIPGCWTRCQVVEEELFQSVCWRFCGGFFCGDRHAITVFSEAIYRHIGDFMKTKEVLAWEVNVWAWMEKYVCPELFQWYLGNHNDTIL